MVQPSREKEFLANLNFDLVILDEAHKARTRQGYGADAGEPNELLTFIRAVAARAQHVLLGTATPIQTRAEDLWDLVRVLHHGSTGFVLGHDLAPWHDPDKVLALLSGKEQVLEPEYGWQLLRSPFPTVESTNKPNARLLFRNLREEMELPDREYFAPATVTALARDLRDQLETELEREIDGTSFFQRVCSSVVAGLNTVPVLLQARGRTRTSEDAEVDLRLQTEEERAALNAPIQSLERMRQDPKLSAIRHLLLDEGWLDLDRIMFSQFYATARWVADSLGGKPPERTGGPSVC
jgi:hypothetical protein